MDDLIIQDAVLVLIVAAVYGAAFSDAVALIATGSFLLGMGWTYIQYRRHRNWHPSTEEYTYRRGARRG